MGNVFKGKKKKEVRVYFLILALTALALALSNSIFFANYFKDAYQVTPYQRGLIEFPREIPGVLCVFFLYRYYPLWVMCVYRLLHRF